MLPWWSFPSFLAVIAALVYAVWKVWRAEIRVWLIPESEIQKAAQDLIRLRGEADAERTAMANSLMAWEHHDILEAGRWDRVAHRLRKIAKEKAASK